MSGHSHFRTIMHKKGAADAKRSQIFSKLARELTIATKEGGTNPMSNPRLRTVMEKAKEANMPSDNVERAIKKAAGGEAGQFEEMLIEAYGPGGIALLITAISDNKNRTTSEIKQILQRNGGKMVEGGSVRWLFERRAVVTIENATEEMELIAIEEGAQDLYPRNNTLDISISPDQLSSFTQKLAERGVHASSSLDWVPKEHVSIGEADTQAAERLFEALDDQDDVHDIYSNI